MPLWLANQQKHVFLDCLGEGPQCRSWIFGHSRGERLAGHKILEPKALIPELEHGWEASWEIVLEQELVELVDGFDTGGKTAVDQGTMLGDDLAPQRDSVKVVCVDGDELRRGVCFQCYFLCVPLVVTLAVKGPTRCSRVCK